MGSGSVAGGSGGEYFVGHFDGTTFTAMQDAKWVDYGRDFYAPVSWSDIPESDGRRIWLGWLNNWETCLVPTSPWRSCMSVPRVLTLRKLASGEDATTSDYTLIQRPVREFSKLTVGVIQLNTDTAAWPPVAVTKPDELFDMNFILETTLQPGNALRADFEFVLVMRNSRKSVSIVNRGLFTLTVANPATSLFIQHSLDAMMLRHD